MQYGIGLKRLLEIALIPFLVFFYSIKIKDAKILTKLPKETTSVRITDYPIQIKEENGKEYIFLLEIQTSWKQEKILDLIDYTVRFTRKYKKPVKPNMLLLLPNKNAKDFYEDNNLTFRFELIKLWEIPARLIFDKKDVTLYPFIPLTSA